MIYRKKRTNESITLQCGRTNTLVKMTQAQEKKDHSETYGRLGRIGSREGEIKSDKKPLSSNQTPLSLAVLDLTPSFT